MHSFQLPIAPSTIARSAKLKRSLWNHLGQPLCYRLLIALAPAVASLLILSYSASLQADEPAQLASIEELKTEFAQLKGLWETKSFGQAAVVVNRCTESLPELLKKSNPKETGELLKIHKRLDAIHELLSFEGASLTPLPSWKELLAEKSGAGTNNAAAGIPRGRPAARSVSFSQDIAPWLVEQCSGCHIQRSEGNFSLANFASLARGVDGNAVIFPGDPVASRLVEVLESGDMPRGGQRASADLLSKLKTWIQEGAQYDNPSPTIALRDLANAGMAMKAASQQLEMNRNRNASRNANRNRNASNRDETGMETTAKGVSFAREIAPLLTENCNGCHLGGNQNMGGLNLNTFAGLMQGGDTGPIVTAGGGEASLLIKKLKGTAGQRMPAGGRPPLADKDIELIAKWINEGAQLDVSGTDLPLPQIVSAAWVANATDEELHQRRIESARAKWQIVAPKSTPEEAQSEHFHVLGNVGPEATKNVLKYAEAAEKQIKKLYGIRSKDSLIKGGINIFVFKQRYDYSEFGTMLEQRQLPPEWSGHWRSNTLDAYVTLIYDPANEKINESSLVQQLTSLWLASLGTPKWFAEGAGRQALASTVSSNDARVQVWMRRIPESLQQVTNLKVFMDEAINDEHYATIGFWLIRTIHETAGKKQYDSLIRTLVGGTAFDQAMLKHVMPVNNFLQQTLGNPSR